MQWSAYLYPVWGSSVSSTITSLNRYLLTSLTLAEIWQIWQNGVLYGLKETVGGDLDRWDYSNSTEGTPPHYKEYTGLTLKWTFGLFFLITAAQFVTMLIVKICTSEKFCRRENFLNKLLHLLLSLNMAFPFEDWDMGRFTTRKYKERQKLTNTEMAWSLSVNIIFSLAMMVPLWYTVKVTSNIFTLGSFQFLAAMCKDEQ